MSGLESGDKVGTHHRAGSSGGRIAHPTWPWCGIRIPSNAGRGALWRILLFTLMTYAFNTHLPHQPRNAVVDQMFAYDQFEWILLTLPSTEYGVMLNRYTGLTLGLLSAAGCLFPWSSLMFTAMYARQFFSMTQAFTNHDYLFILMLFLTALSGTGKTWSLDALLFRFEDPSPYNHCVVLLRAQVAIVYMFACIWKLHSDWLSGSICREIFYGLEDSFHDIPWRALEKAFPWIFQFLAVSGLLLDFFMFLSWLVVRPTPRRMIFMFLAHWLFHGFTFVAMGKRIGYMFPTVMLCAEVLLLPVADAPTKSALTWLRRIVLRKDKTTQLARAFVIVWLTFQILTPLRMVVFHGDTFPSTGEAYRFSWTMMLHSKSSIITAADSSFQTPIWYLIPKRKCLKQEHCSQRTIMRPEYENARQIHMLDDPRSLPVHALPVRSIATLSTFWRQLPRVSHGIVSILQLNARAPSPVAVYAVVYSQLNGVGPWSRLVDPTVDLERVDRALQARSLLEMLLGVVTDRPPPNRNLEVFLRPSPTSRLQYSREPYRQFFQNITDGLKKAFNRSNAFLISDRAACLAAQPLWLQLGKRPAAIVVLRSPVPLEVRDCNPVRKDNKQDIPCTKMRSLVPTGVTGVGGFPDNLHRNAILVQDRVSIEIGMDTTQPSVRSKLDQPCRDADEDILLGLVV